MELSITDRLDAVSPEEWDRLGGGDDPFLSHAFLSGLEHHGCLGARFGWYPRHLLLREPGGPLVAALPLYAKTNNYGEFVFDWAWEQAWQRAGLAYYPKLVSAVPYTPATGRRLLVHPERPAGPLRRTLIQQATAFARDQDLSGLHLLFTDAADTPTLEAEGLALRMGCQYHWQNRGYGDFEDFLEGFSSKRRKNVRRERRRVREQGIELRVLHGDEAGDGLWSVFHGFYLDTFQRKAGIPTLTLPFFRETARTLGRRVVLILAQAGDRPVAAALCYRGRDTLYGRYWGCHEDHDDLHFEACYYQGIDYCIREGLARFEPGAQGEHKIGRGFLPTPTWSAHWIREPGLRDPVAAFCREERAAMEDRCEALMALSPFRRDEASGDHGG
ncbi:MAG: GNAT family N-acetyltransferase [Ectothiorhodospira sp.]